MRISLKAWLVRADVLEVSVTLTDVRVTSKFVENYAATSVAKVAPENEPASERKKSISFHHHHVRNDTDYFPYKLNFLCN